MDRCDFLFFLQVRFAKPVLPGFVILFNRLDLPNLYYLDRPYKQICGKMRVITRNDIFGHYYCKSYDIISSLICIINDHMYVQINSCINKLCHRL
jgi:hypothetical protein